MGWEYCVSYLSITRVVILTQDTMTPVRQPQYITKHTFHKEHSSPCLLHTVDHSVTETTIPRNILGKPYVVNLNLLNYVKYL